MFTSKIIIFQIHSEAFTSKIIIFHIHSEASSEFVALYHRLISSEHWKYYLSVKGVLTTIASLITREIETLNQLERVTLNSDLAQGFALKTLTDLLASFVVVDPIKMTFKSRLVSTVLHGYLSLRRLVVQRTKLVDQVHNQVDNTVTIRITV